MPPISPRASAAWWPLLLLLALAGGDSTSSCPAPCKCNPSTVLCGACPNAYVTPSAGVETIALSACADVEFMLKLHLRSNSTSTLKRLEIRGAVVRQPGVYLNGDHDLTTLVLSNDSLTKVPPCEIARSNLTALDLSHNAIENLGNRTFANLTALTRLDISGNRIVNVSDMCFEGLARLVRLDLSMNNLTGLSESVFLPLTSLQQLNLSANMIEVLSERSFSSLLLLQQLDISYNRLTSVAPGTLQFLPNLAKLVMADNPQLRPDAQIFVGTGRRLQQVDASRTGLSQVPEALTHSVRYLTLAGNRIASVRCGDLDSYPLLQMLDFTGNIIEDIEDDALGRLELLSQLYLNRNKLQTVPKMLPDKLSYLSLDNNLIRNLTIIDFVSLGGLKMLIISNNNVSYIQENAFIQLVSLEVLDLSNNPLKVLTPNTFSGPPKLKDLRIAHVNASPPAKDISFPVPAPESLENLQLEYSPGLTRQLMADTAALAAMTRLQHLDLRYANVTSLRSDLLHFLPELKFLRLEGNRLDCDGLNWLGDWMRENPTNDYAQVKCAAPLKVEGKLVKDLAPSTVPHPTKYANISKTKKSTSEKKKEISNKKAEVKTTESPQIDKMDGRSKLLQIFAEWSQEPEENNNNRNEQTTTAPSVVPPGSPNGAENKTKWKIETYDELNATLLVLGNVSEYRTSRFSSERGGGGAGAGALAAVGGLAAVGAAFAAAAWTSRRPRQRHHLNVNHGHHHHHHQDLMEVPTIAAVGELW